MIPESTIQEAVRRIVEAFAPERVIVFGSAARGDQGPKSDLDLLVIVPRIENRRAMTTAMSGLLWGLRIPCDLLVLTGEEFERERGVIGSVIRPAAAEGRVVYDRAA
jgi:predicted nucleotidyltransferase